MADERELFAIADALKSVGHGNFQFSPEHVRVPVDEWPWMCELARRSGRPVSVNLNQTDQAPDLWRTVLSLIDEAHAQRLPIFSQVAGRSIGILYGLQGSVHPLMFHPAYLEVAGFDLSARISALSQPERRARLIDDIPDDGGLFQRVVLDKAEGMWIVRGPSIDYEPSAQDSIGALARRTGTPIVELILDQLCSDGGQGLIYAPFFNYSYGDLSMTYEAHRHPHTRLGLSDAGAHCGAICDGGMPTFMLTHWVRDRTRGPRFDLEFMVHRQTRQTAEFYGLFDRGLIAPGQRADLNVIDFDSLGFEAPHMVFDLPAAGRRLVQKARGYAATFVAGVQTVDNDEFTGELPGRLVRGPQR
jgi:N-acyl-D-aspartate/D-glutamate deacylase